MTIAQRFNVGSRGSWAVKSRRDGRAAWQKGKRVDDNVWDVNVDASLSNSTAIRTAATYGKWHVVTGTFAGKEKGAKPLILDPGATDNTFEIHPPIEQYAWEDNSGNHSNVILSGARRGAALSTK